MLGYDLEVIDELHNVMNGAVIRLNPNELDRLKHEVIVSGVYEEKLLKTNLERSLKLVGADNIEVRSLNGEQLTGEGVRVAVVDTGIDYTHPDLLGFGNGGKIVRGYDFLERDEQPMDTDGHGTLVAGIIAADGMVKGVAPKAELVAYRIASEGDYVSTADMISALDRAVDDEIDVMNISLGLDYISEEIDAAIEKLVSKGIVVVAAAGNNGEVPESNGKTGQIGSPASAPSAISVGASFNNVTVSAVATLTIDDQKTRFNVIPMEGSPITAEPVSSRVVFANFATVQDMEQVNAKGAIVLAERGGPMIDVDGNKEAQLVYFRDKELNAAMNGAAALIVFNNERGNYHGTLIREAPLDYRPTIPVVSMSLEEGMMLKDMVQNGDVNAEFNIFFSPDVVAPFSSRGPVSPFYLKPTIVAPGAYINSTSIGNSYNVTSGTSFAAPHVTGAVALLLQKNPTLTPSDIASILATTARPVNDAYDLPYPFEAAGAGRLDVDAALKTSIVATPYYTIFHLSEGKQVAKEVQLKSIDGPLDSLDVSTEWNHPIKLDVYVNRISEGKASLVINAQLSESVSGTYEGRVYVKSGEHRISIPVIAYADEVGISANNKDGRIWLSIDSQEKWTFAKVKVINAENGRSHFVTLTPSKNILSVPARNFGEHWIEADVITNGGESRGFSVLQVSDITTDGMLYDLVDIYGIPVKEGLMIISFLGIAAAVVYIWNRRNKTMYSIMQPSS
jgi:minor extracellular serine protease Vpr